VIGIIDYKAGNARSVQYALTRLGVESQLVTAPSELETLDRIVLPGVGSAQATMDFLHDSGCGGALTELVRDGAVPFLGICVGLQVLFEHSEEGDVKCLGWLPGQVRRFTGPPAGGGKAPLRVPQIGWNEVNVRVEDAWFDGWDKRYCYFVNSYHAVSEAPVAATANYGGEFTAAVRAGNITATQFHIEKSGPDGLELLQRWATC
jgi:glutamine amidotransferase